MVPHRWQEGFFCGTFTLSGEKHREQLALHYPLLCSTTPSPLIPSSPVCTLSGQWWPSAWCPLHAAPDLSGLCGWPDALSSPYKSFLKEPIRKAMLYWYRFEWRRLLFSFHQTARQPLPLATKLKFCNWIRLCSKSSVSSWGFWSLDIDHNKCLTKSLSNHLSKSSPISEENDASWKRTGPKSWQVNFCRGRLCCHSKFSSNNKLHLICTCDLPMTRRESSAVERQVMWHS